MSRIVTHVLSKSRDIHHGDIPIQRGKINNCICMAEPLCCTSETTTTWLTDYTSIWNKKFLKKIKVKRSYKKLNIVSNCCMFYEKMKECIISLWNTVKNVFSKLNRQTYSLLSLTVFEEGKFMTQWWHSQGWGEKTEAQGVSEVWIRLYSKLVLATNENLGLLTLGSTSFIIWQYGPSSGRFPIRSKLMAPFVKNIL